MIAAGLDISNLLDSSICCYRMEADHVEHINCFLEFHTNDETRIVNYKKSFMELLHDEEAYDQLFGEEFP